MQYYKKTSKVLLIVLGTLLLTSCGKSNNNIEISQKDLDISIPKAVKFIDYQINKTDTEVSLSFSQYKYGNLNIEKNVKYNIEGEGEITINIEGKGEYTEFIPKSFANNINDIEFSIKPDKIIDEDPIAKWMVDTIEGKSKTIIMKVKQAAGINMAKNNPLGLLSNLGKMINNEGFDFSSLSKQDKESAIDGGIDEMMNHLEDFIFVSDVAICANKKDEMQQLFCILAMVSRKPQWFDCNNVFKNEKKHLLYACKAIQKNDYKECDILNNTSDSCKLYYFNTLVLRCQGISNTNKDCYLTSTKQANYPDGCLTLEDDDKNECLDQFGLKIENNNTNIENSDSCYEKSEGFYRNICFKDKARKECDTNYCFNLEETRDQEECIISMARDCGIKNCLEIKGSDYRVKCIRTLAKTKKDCDLIGGDNRKDLMDWKDKNKSTCLERNNLK